MLKESELTLMLIILVFFPSISIIPCAPMSISLHVQKTVTQITSTSIHNATITILS